MDIKSQIRKEKSLSGVVLLPTAINCLQQNLLGIEAFGLERRSLLIELLNFFRACCCFLRDIRWFQFLARAFHLCLIRRWRTEAFRFEKAGCGCYRKWMIVRERGSNKDLRELWLGEREEERSEKGRGRAEEEKRVYIEKEEGRRKREEEQGREEGAYTKAEEARERQMRRKERRSEARGR